MSPLKADFTILPCSMEDVPAMVEVYINAFASNYFNTIWAPASSVNRASMTEWLLARFKAALLKPEMKIFKAVDGSNGQMAAWVRWTYPFVLTDEEKVTRQLLKAQVEARRDRGEEPPEWPVGAQVGACEAFFGALDGMKVKYADESQQYICHLLATDPAYQRKGLGRMLLQHVLDLADEQGRTAYIEATEAGHVLYQRLGWKDIDKIVIDLNRWGGEEPGVNYVMLRAPKGPS